jgi:hypothetical protein
VILLVCGLQLYGQQTASGAEDGPKPPTYITFNPTGSVYIQSMAINPAGAIAGFFQDANGVSHGFLRARDGMLTPLDVPGAGATSYPQGTWVYAITPAVAIAGYYVDNVGNAHTFLRAPNGTYKIINDPPGYNNTQAYCINLL